MSNNLQSDESHELSSWNATYGGTFGEISSNRYEASDNHTLAKLGKQHVLKRRFGYISIFGFSCTILITWETVLALFPQALANGGPAGLVWGFLIAWACSLSIYMCLSEMASLAPIAGGQYFWVAILAPRSQKRFLSYITGWLTTLAWIATLAVGVVYTGTMIQSIAILNHPTYSAEKWHTTLIAWAVVAVALFINTVLAGALPLLEGFVLVLHIVGFIAVLITMVYLSDHGSAESVFSTTLNTGGWPTLGLSLCVGFIGNVATFVGADAAVHMAEEIENAALNVPRAIFTTVILNGATGFAMTIAVLFCLGDAETVLETPTGLPFVQVFANGTGNAGATALTIIVLLLAWAASTGFLATGSRMIWSFARDKGLPFHAILSKVDTRTRVPIVSVLVVTVIPCLLFLIYIGSSTVYQDVISLSVCGLYGSYFLACACLLWRRCTGQIKPRAPHEDVQQDMFSNFHAQTNRRPSGKDTFAESEGFDPAAGDDVLIDPPLQWGPWHVPGWLGIINNAFACMYALFVLFWDFWPPSTPTTPSTMNYSSLVFGVVIIFAIIYYFVYGRFHYKGPLIDYEVRSVANRMVVTRKGST